MREKFSARPTVALRRHPYRTLAAILALVLVGYGLGVVTRSPSLPGVESASPNFTIVVEHPNVGSRTGYDRLPFTRSLPGWDFGDRYNYDCAFVENFDSSGALQFVVLVQRVATPSTTDPAYVLINDRGGAETSDTGVPNPKTGSTAPHLYGCGKVAFDGTDHFPHYSSGHTADVPMRFYRDGVEFTSIDLRRDMCARGYWTPGDEPGEAWLWWDEDGPTNNGHMQLDCGGDVGGTIPVARISVTAMTPGISVCTSDDLDGERCT